MGYREFYEELMIRLKGDNPLGVDEQDVKFYDCGYVPDGEEDIMFVRETNIKYYQKESEILLGDFVVVFLPEDHTQINRFSVKVLFNEFQELGWNEVWKHIRENMELSRKVAGLEVVDMLHDYDMIKSHLFIRPLNYNAHRRELTKAIWRQVGDIALVLYVLLYDEYEGDHHNVGSFKAPQSVFEHWNKDFDEVWDEALINTNIISPPRMFTNSLDIYKAPYSKGTFMSINSEITELLPHEVPAVTTTTQTNGAIAMFYPGVRERIADMIGGDYYVAFTSINEARIHKVGTISPTKILRRIKKVNRWFATEEALSRKLYLYEAASGKFDVKEV